MEIWVNSSSLFWISKLIGKSECVESLYIIASLLSGSPKFGIGISYLHIKCCKVLYYIYLQIISKYKSRFYRSINIFEFCTHRMHSHPSICKLFEILQIKDQREKFRYWTSLWYNVKSVVFMNHWTFFHRECFYTMLFANARIVMYIVLVYCVE